jgi:hypothetical protein
MSKNIENGSLSVVLAQIENIFVSKAAVGANLRQVKYFLVVDDQKVLHLAKVCVGSGF